MYIYRSKGKREGGRGMEDRWTDKRTGRRKKLGGQKDGWMEGRQGVDGWTDGWISKVEE